MNGVNILNVKYTLSFPSCLDYFFIVGMILILSFLVIEAYGFKKPFNEIREDVALLSFLGAIITFLIGIFLMIPFHYKVPEYQVTVSDEVNFNEFYNRYEILEQNGLIYTIKEK